MKSTSVNTIDEYIRTFPFAKRSLLIQLHSAIKNAVPDAEEIISYNMPAFKIHKRILVYFACQTNHVGFYPGAGAVMHFQKQLVKYETSKGSIRFPLDEPLPLSLITRIVKFRVQQNELKLRLKKK